MGLDGVEIVMATEEAFGIVIPDEVAGRLVTPGDLGEYVFAHVPSKPSSECLTQQLFFRLRRGFRSQAPSSVNRFNLDAPLSEIFQKDQWNGVWSAIRASVGQNTWPEQVPWPTLFGKGPKTVRQLIWQVVASLPRPNIDEGETWTRQRIEGEIGRIVVDQLGIQDFEL